MAYDASKARQEQFEAVMLQKLKEEKGSALIPYAQKAIVKGANIHNFYRLGESKVGTGEFNMYKDSYAGTGGTAEKIPATITSIYASDRIKKDDINSTSINLESSYIKSLSDALHREVDKKILDAIKAKKSTGTTAEAGHLTPMGDSSKKLSDTANIDALIQATVFASTNVKDMTASTESNGVAMVVTAKEFSELFTAEKVGSTNYMGVTQSGNLKTMFGCEVVKVSEYAKPVTTTSDPDVVGTIYLIPTQTIGVASWENDIEAKTWVDESTDSIACRVKRSLGVAVIEPESIIEFKYKAK